MNGMFMRIIPSVLLPLLCVRADVMSAISKGRVEGFAIFGLVVVAMYCYYGLEIILLLSFKTNRLDRFKRNAVWYTVLSVIIFTLGVILAVTYDFVVGKFVSSFAIHLIAATWLSKYYRTNCEKDADK